MPGSGVSPTAGPGGYGPDSMPVTVSPVAQFWITYTEAARQRMTPFRPDHMVRADRYVVDDNLLIFTSPSLDGRPRRVLLISNDDVARIELIEDWQAEARKSVEAEAYRRALAATPRRGFFRGPDD